MKAAKLWSCRVKQGGCRTADGDATATGACGSGKHGGPGLSRSDTLTTRPTRLEGMSFNHLFYFFPRKSPLKLHVEHKSDLSLACLGGLCSHQTVSHSVPSGVIAMSMASDPPSLAQTLDKLVNLQVCGNCCHK